MIKAILLAAGQSKRLKNENKLIKKFKNKSLINYPLNSLIKSNVNKIIIVLGHESAKIKKIIKKNKKIIFVINKKYKSGMSSSIKAGLKKISKKDNGFIIVQSDMPFIKTTIINKICTSIIKKKYLIHAPKFKKIKGKIGAKFMVKRLEKSTNFIKVSSGKFFKDFDLSKDFN